MDFLLECMNDADCSEEDKEKIINYQNNIEKITNINIDDKENVLS